MKNPLVNPRNPWAWLTAIVIATIVGHVTLEIVTGKFLDWSLWEWIWYPLLLALGVGVTVVTVPRIPTPRFWRGSADKKPDVQPLNDIESAPALVVFVSTNPTGPYRTAIDQFATASGSLLKHVFLVHSELSKHNADTLYREINDDAARAYTAHKDGLLADFSDVGDMYRVSLIAVDHALEQVDPRIEPEDVVIDVTGGTAIASAGAVLAGLRRTGITLTYIAPSPTGELGDTIRRVDVTLVPDQADEGAGPDGEAA
jgi:hypothetical protein